MITVNELYRMAQKPWGGATIDLSTGDALPDGMDAYAVAVGQTVTIPVTASLAEFADAYARADRSATHLGIFHDADHGVIEFDAVRVVKTTAEVDALYRESAFSGGAYNFATGDGYWPGQ
jgi:hypothetical protein